MLNRVLPLITLKHKRYGAISGELVTNSNKMYCIKLDHEMIDGEHVYRKGWRIICAHSESSHVVITPVTKERIDKHYKR